MSRKDANVVGPHTSLSKKGLWKKRFTWAISAVAILVLCLFVRHRWGAEPANAQAPQRKASPRQTSTRQAAPRQTTRQQAAEPRKLQVMAVVNNQKISRQTLANACLDRFGTDVLESMVNKYLISGYCRERNITITHKEINDEIERVASRFRLGREQWLKMLAEERGINPEQYSRDIIWPTVALRKLAADRLTVSRDELAQAYEREFGESIKARLIAVSDPSVARSVQAQAQAQPAEFARLAREHSEDGPTASIGGLLPPIRRHMGDKQIEQVAFNMRQGDISPIMRVGEQYVILKCEGRIPRREVAPQAVQKQLEDKIRDKKLRKAASEVFEQLQAKAKVENILNDPVKSRQMPGVAATINGQKITIRELAEECLVRHSEEVLENEINHLLLQQALKKRNIQVTQQDLDAEILHGAELAGIVDSKGQPDMKRWIDMVTKQQKVSYDVYINDAVWPSTALKKLVRERVKVEQKDLDKGFDANYGPQARCRAIVLSNLRRAQQVWDMARQNPSVENFGKLAEQYSIEASSRDLHGEVPPIRKNGGQPTLEKEAFAMKPGDISGVIQLGDKFIILRCEGFTKPMAINMTEVKDLIHRDIFEKKLRIAMGRRFEALQKSARIDNYVAGTTQAPKKKSTAGKAVSASSRTANRDQIVPRVAPRKGEPRRR